MAEGAGEVVVGFDAKRLVRNRTGLGNYARFVAESLACFSPEIRQVHSASGAGNPALYGHLKAYPSFRLLTPALKGLPFGDFLWRNFTSRGPLLRRGVQLYHGLSGELPASIRKWGIPSVVTMHDLIYELFPQFYSRIDARLYHEKYRRSCLDADCIVAVSACTKRDLVRLYGIPEEKVRVIYQGCDPAFREPATEEKLREVRQRYGLESPFVLSVGTIEERKNALSLVRALSLSEDKKLQLLLVGRETKYTEKVREEADRPDLKGRVRILSGVPFSDLPALYRLAEVFAYPSLYEGFGIPVLEALNSGTPVVAGAGSCLEEAGGSGSLYADPRDPADLARKLEEARERREEMIPAGKAWAERFLPEKSAPELAALYRSLVK